MTPKLIKEDIEICRFDGVSSATVYKGGLSYLTCVDNLLWRIDENGNNALRLSEIANQLHGDRIITVIEESPMESRIYQRGNYSDSWYLIAEGCGYA